MDLTAAPLAPTQCAGCSVAQTEGEFVLLHPARNSIMPTKETAALIGQMCDGVNTMDPIVEIFSDAYPDARAQIAKEGPETIQNLRAQGARDGG